jgi:Outer membrane lipoprotein carrier protein LolA-like
MSACNAALVVLGCLVAATAGAAPDARTLVEKLARESPSTVAFTEARFSSLLRQPLVVSGELGYLGGGSLDRRVTSPYRETITIRGSTVRIEREGEEVRSFALERAPELEGFLKAFGALLAGDSAALEKTFAIAATGDDIGDWTLELTPLNERARRRVSMIRIYGSGDELQCLATIDTKETGSVMLLGGEPSATISSASSFDDLIAHCRGR